MEHGSFTPLIFSTQGGMSTHVHTHTSTGGSDGREMAGEKVTAKDSSSPTCTTTETIQGNLSIKDTPYKGHLSDEDTDCSPNHKELCTNLPLN